MNIKYPIYTERLTKKYKKQHAFALDNFSCAIQEGEIVGLLGPNGSGKSTLIKILLGAITPTIGDARLLGIDPLKLKTQDKEKLGVIFGSRSSLIYHLPALESVKLFAAIYNISKKDCADRLHSYAELLDCERFLTQRVATLSLGQRLRVELLCLLIHKPKVIILDEPTLGLDIEGKRVFRNVLRKLADTERITVLLATHDVDDAQRVCDRIILLKDGLKIEDMSRTEFEAHLDAQLVLVTDKPCPEKLNLKYLETTDGQHRYIVPKEQANDLANHLFINFQINTLATERPRLEDSFYAHYRNCN